MTQKKRIIELVKQNVLSMEEALQLLEAASYQQNDENETIDKNEFVTEYQEAQKAIEETIGQVSEEPTDETTKEEQANIEVQLAELKTELSKKEEALIIAKQRLREIEIFAELDELTPEMETQRVSLSERVEKISNEIEEIKTKIALLKKSQVKQVQSQFKKMVEDTTEQVTQAARDFGKEASKEGKNIKESVLKGIKDLVSNFDMKTININVPWVKSTKLEQTYVYDAKDLSQIDFSLVHGSIKLEAVETEQVEIAADITIFGNEERATLAEFESNSTIDVSDNRVLFHVKGATVAADLNVKVPKQLIEDVRIGAINGDIELEGLNVKELKLDSKNGDTKLNKITAEFIGLEGVNGDVHMEASVVKDFDYHNLNGDFRYKDQVGNLSANVINGDIVITKKDETASNLNIKTVAGDIKVAVPKGVNLEIDVQSSLGDFEHRLTNIDTLGNLNRFERHLNEQAPLVKIEARTNTGDIYLKD